MNKKYISLLALLFSSYSFANCTNYIKIKGDADNYNIMHDLTLLNKVNEVQTLIETKCVSINQNKTKDSGSPLFFFANSKEMMNIFIKYKVNLQEKDNMGSKALINFIALSNENNQENVIEISKKYNLNAANEYLSLRDKNKNINFLKYLVENLKYNVNEPDKNGTTPLMYASAYNNYDYVKYLLDKGANPNVKNRMGANAYHYNLIPREDSVYINNETNKKMIRDLLDKVTNYKIDKKINPTMQKDLSTVKNK